MVDAAYAPFKAYLVYNLFWFFETLQEGQNPIPPLKQKYKDAITLIKTVKSSNFNVNLYPQANEIDLSSDSKVEKYLTDLYSSLWVGMSDEIYFDEGLMLLTERLKVNGLDPYKLFKDKYVVDAGCGSGKWTCAIARLGAKKVLGIDIGKKGLEFANKMKGKISEASCVEFSHANLTNITLEDESVDFLFSNGVVHHTVDYNKCLKEFFRVLKHTGEMYLFVNGPWGLWELHLDNTLKVVCRSIPQRVMYNFLVSTGMHSGAIYWVMDNFYVPYERKSKDELEELLHQVGFVDLRQLARGLESDYIEKVFRNAPYASLRYGEAQLKYLAKKP